MSGSLDPEFWSNTVLQVSHNEAVVRQALVALSSMHLQYVSKGLSQASSSTGESKSSEPLRQYNKAVRHLRRYLKVTAEPSHRVVLTCSALFCCFESTCGHHEAALKHLDGGLAVLHEAVLNQEVLTSSDSSMSTIGEPLPRLSTDTLEASDSRAAASHSSFLMPAVVEDMTPLLQLFTRLDLQATFFNEDRPLRLDLTPRATTSLQGLKQNPIAFTTLAGAQWVLEKLENQFFRLLLNNSDAHHDTSLDKLPAHIVQEKLRLQDGFLTWQQQMTALEARYKDRDNLGAIQDKPSRPSTEMSYIFTLHIYHQVSIMLLRSVFPKDPSIFGAIPNAAAEEIIVLAAKVAGSVSSCGHRTYSAVQGVLAPLFLLAMKCKDVSVRRRALALLETMRGRREGLFKAGVLADICKKIAKMQQSGKVDCGDDAIALEFVAPAITESRGGIAEYARLLAVDTHD